MVVTATDLKTNLGKYLDLLDTDDIIVTRNGRRIARLIRDEEDVLAEVQSLYGILAGTGADAAKEDDTKPAIPEERVRRYDRIDWYERNS
ncbi:MAG: type II toxin-antitoxin system Phd/YefM family antitoxin [Defluviitaleaceae bacterium]|nr:type II toxin-antitoxin system Phd/YefM family antitoxin [Defluviitaleaceae bacterium]